MLTRLRFLVLTGLAALTLSAHPGHDSPATVAQAANNFLAALTPEQAAKAKFAFSDEQRFDWHFIPRERKGLPIREMTPPQRSLANGLLSAVLSQQGYIKATTIMSLEDVLRILEKDSGERRNVEKYYFSLFGDPAEKGTWGFRLEGHHLSLNYTLVDGKVASSPMFFGANPAEVREGPRAGLRALRYEEDLGRRLVQSLTPEQKKVAIVDAKAPADIFTMNSRKAALNGQPSGLLMAKMTAQQKQHLRELIDEYIDNLPPLFARKRREQVKAAGDKIYFAWAGAEEPKSPHYYRIQAPTFLIEYDNTQNNNNHIHCVWRDFNGDFGDDLLGQHYKTSPHGTK